MSITLKNINELTQNTPNQNDKIVFGKSGVTELFSASFQQVFEAFGGASAIEDLSYQVISIPVLLSNPIPSQSLGLTVNNLKGRITFIKYNVLVGDSLGQDTYLLLKGEGTHTGLTYGDLLRVNREEGDIENAPNTVTYSVADLNEVNTASPPFDFSDENLFYFVNLGGLLYEFNGVNGFYGENDLQLQLSDLNLITGSTDIVFDNELSLSSTNGVQNSVIFQEFLRTNFLGISLNQSISTQFDVNFINYRFIHKVDTNTINITGRFDAPKDFNCYGVVESGSINFLVESGLDLVAPNGTTVNAGEYFHFVKIDDGKTYVLVRYNYGSGGGGTINNITEIPNRSYNDLQDLPNLQALAFLNTVGTDEINNNSVTNQKLANMDEGTIKGREIGNGVPQDLTPTQVRSILGVSVSVTQPPQLVNGVVQVDLSNPQGIFSESTVTTTEQFEVIAGAVTGGIHVFRVNLPSDPDASITGATRYLNSEFIPNVNLLLVFERFNFGTRYYFLEI